MTDVVLGVLSLVVFARLAFEMTRGWPRGKKSPLSGPQRVGALLVFGGVICLLITCVSDFTAKRMDIYSQSFKTATRADAFAERIGQPFSVAWPVSLTAGVSDEGNDASFRATVKGPLGKGVLTAAGKKNGTTWHLTELYLAPSSSGQNINLLSPEPLAPIKQ